MLYTIALYHSALTCYNSLNGILKILLCNKCSFFSGCMQRCLIHNVGYVSSCMSIIYVERKSRECEITDYTTATVLQSKRRTCNFRFEELQLKYFFHVFSKSYVYMY